MQDKITKPITRELISDFAEELKKRQLKNVTPKYEVIYFRDEHLKGIQREIAQVPIDLLRYRKDNGRITSDVLSYEISNTLLVERSEEAQKILRKILYEKDPERTKELKNSLVHTGQKSAAIVTADGFLINGNRRKMALEELWKETQEQRYQWMKVVILPGEDDEGGPPTLKEIEQIENRYQLQSEGKAEYYNFDRALSIRRKIYQGMSLEEQLKDDPNFIRLSLKDFKREVQKYKEQYIDPLECVDRYLDLLGRPQLYNTISSGVSDKEGRWQAFLDYYNHLRKKLDDEYQRSKLGIDDDETGAVEEIAFKIIRKREFKDMGKVHKIIRDLPKWISNKEAKKELFKLLDIDFKLTNEDCYDSNGNEYNEREKDRIWGGKYNTVLHKHVKNAERIFLHEKDRETPISLLMAALKKLEHENMRPDVVCNEDIPKAMKLAKKIQDVANIIESEFYKIHKK